MTEVKRTYTIPLRRGYNETPRHRRAKRAMSVIRTFLAKHMKSETIKIGKVLNEIIWENGMKNPPAKVTIDVTKDDAGVVTAELEGVKYVDNKPEEKKAAPKNMKEKLQQKVSEAAAKKVENKTKEAAGSKKEAKAEDKPAKKESLEAQVEKPAAEPVQKDADKKAE